MPDVSSPHITSPPSHDGQPYDAASDAAVGPWAKPTDVADFSDKQNIPGADGAAPWRQT